MDRMRILSDRANSEIKKNEDEKVKYPDHNKKRKVESMDTYKTH